MMSPAIPGLWALEGALPGVSALGTLLFPGIGSGCSGFSAEKIKMWYHKQKV